MVGTIRPGVGSRNAKTRRLCLAMPVQRSKTNPQPPTSFLEAQMRSLVKRFEKLEREMPVIDVALLSDIVRMANAAAHYFGAGQITSPILIGKVRRGNDIIPVYAKDIEGGLAIMGPILLRNIEERKRTRESRSTGKHVSVAWSFCSQSPMRSPIA